LLGFPARILTTEALSLSTSGSGTSWVAMLLLNFWTMCKELKKKLEKRGYFCLEAAAVAADRLGPHAGKPQYGLVSRTVLKTWDVTG
jgi:hypothetical protein